MKYYLRFWIFSSICTRVSLIELMITDYWNLVLHLSTSMYKGLILLILLGPVYGLYFALILIFNTTIIFLLIFIQNVFGEETNFQVFFLDCGKTMGSKLFLSPFSNKINKFLCFANDCPKWFVGFIDEISIEKYFF